MASQRLSPTASILDGYDTEETSRTSSKSTAAEGSTQRSSAFAGFRFPLEVILLAVRWYLRFGLSYQDLEELQATRRRGRSRHAAPLGATIYTVAD